MRTIQIFLGGGVKLLHGENEFLKGYRNDVIDPIISQLNSKEFAKHLFIAKDYSDLTRNVVTSNHQEVYNNFIVDDAQVALFIINGKIGNITKHEIDVAVASTKKSHHPIVYVYGKNVKDNDEVLEYLNQEGIYFQHFFDNRDLASKIKADLEIATQRLDRQRVFRLGISLLMSLVLCGGVLLSLKKCTNTDIDKNTIDYCSAQLYLMRYKDVNALTETAFITDEQLSGFMYEDSIMTGNDISVFPIIGKDSLITSTPPFFQLKLHNRHRNTIVFVENILEIDQYVSDTVVNKESIRTIGIPIKEITRTDFVFRSIDIEGDGEYYINGFRQNLAYDETDARYAFAIYANENCSFRMRVRMKSQLGKYLYSNYTYVNYIR